MGATPVYLQRSPLAFTFTLKEPIQTYYTIVISSTEKSFGDRGNTWETIFARCAGLELPLSVSGVGDNAMTDESSPPRKIGSLRDRIAAFEKQSSTSNTLSNPPPIRPKPGSISWKPKQPSPPPSPRDEDKGCATPAKSPTSGADAIEGGDERRASLKERIAALQGNGPFSLANPPPRPTTEKPKFEPPRKPPPRPTSKKPKWDPPPKPVTSPSPTTEEPPANFEAVIRSPPLGTEPAETPVEQPAESTERGGKGGETKDDSEGEERQQRAATAAHPQQLGGARKAPPVVASKPPISRPSFPSQSAPMWRRGEHHRHDLADIDRMMIRRKPNNTIADAQSSKAQSFSEQNLHL